MTGLNRSHLLEIEYDPGKQVISTLSILTFFYFSFFKRLFFPSFFNYPLVCCYFCVCIWFLIERWWERRRVWRNFPFVVVLFLCSFVFFFVCVVFFICDFFSLSFFSFLIWFDSFFQIWNLDFFPKRKRRIYLLISKKIIAYKFLWLL